jgi:hypothetical protein
MFKRNCTYVSLTYYYKCFFLFIVIKKLPFLVTCVGAGGKNMEYGSEKQNTCAPLGNPPQGLGYTCVCVGGGVVHFPKGILAFFLCNNHGLASPLGALSCCIITQASLHVERSFFYSFKLTVATDSIPLKYQKRCFMSKEFSVKM